MLVALYEKCHHHECVISNDISPLIFETFYWLTVALKIWIQYNISYGKINPEFEEALGSMYECQCQFLPMSGLLIHAFYLIQLLA